MDKRRASYLEGSNSSPTILIVDDEPDTIELLGLTLARMGMEFSSATCISEAKTSLQARKFQLCITDMRLPDGSGLDLLRYITHYCSDLPVAVITAYSSTENAIAALKDGAFDYLFKPVSLKGLRNLVKAALILSPLQTGAIVQKNQISVCCRANRNPCANSGRLLKSFPAAKPQFILTVNRVVGKT